MVATKLVLKGFMVGFAFGNCGYDLVSDWNGTLRRIQVKSTRQRHHSGWKVNVRRISSKGSSPYSKKDADFLIIRIAPTGDTYVIPVKEVSKIQAIGLNPGSNNKFEKYHEAFNLLK